MKPITVAAIESDPNYVYEDVDGKVYDHYDLTFPLESWQRIREGRACLRCWEPQTIPYLTATTEQRRRTPEKHLPGCEYSGKGIQMRQAQDISKEFYGHKWIGPKQRLEDTIAEDDERRAKYRQDTSRVAGIVVPSNVKL